ncbi:hypothetical protein KW787_04290 [Candidatus Pacearchaeota archaeon]|nr:hypothetical protein [Candidatus Pacearchaeota archaeon]
MSEKIDELKKKLLKAKDSEEVLNIRIEIHETEYKSLKTDTARLKYIKPFLNDQYNYAYSWASGKLWEIKSPEAEEIRAQLRRAAEFKMHSAGKDY